MDIANFRTTFSVTKGQTTSWKTDHFLKNRPLPKKQTTSRKVDHFPKNRPLPEKQSNVVYKMRGLLLELYRWDRQSSRKEGHKRNVQQCKSGSNKTKHAWTQDHKLNQLWWMQNPRQGNRSTQSNTGVMHGIQQPPKQYRFLLKKNRS
jgi:hypothetical protein